MGISPSAEGEGGCSPLHPRPLFEKSGAKTFHRKVFYFFGGAVPLSLIGLLFSVSFSNGREE